MYNSLNPRHKKLKSINLFYHPLFRLQGASSMWTLNRLTQIYMNMNKKYMYAIDLTPISLVL